MASTDPSSQTPDIASVLQLLMALLGKGSKGQSSGSGPRKFDPNMMAPMSPVGNEAGALDLSNPLLLGADIAGQQGSAKTGIGLDTLAILSSALRH